MATLVLADGRLRAVIDFGSCGTGDPAVVAGEQHLRHVVAPPGGGLGVDGVLEQAVLVRLLDERLRVADDPGQQPPDGLDHRQHRDLAPDRLAHRAGQRRRHFHRRLVRFECDQRVLRLHAVAGFDEDVELAEGRDVVDARIGAGIGEHHEAVPDEDAATIGHERRPDSAISDAPL